MKVIFSGGWNIASVFIKTQTACRWYHCGVINDAGLVVEARMTGGVVVSFLDEFKSRGQWVIIDIPLNDEQAAHDFLDKQIGKGYDVSGLFAYLFNKRSWQTEHKWYCSELVAAAAEIGGSSIVRSDLSGVSPRDIWVGTHSCIDASEEKFIGSCT